MKSVACIKTGNLNDSDKEKRGKVSTIDISEEQVGDDEVKIKVAYCAICGSDPHEIEGIFLEEPPFGLGHEVSGTIIEIGKNATIKGLKIGDRVGGNFLRYCGTCYYCRNAQEQFCEHTIKKPCMSEYLVWNESQVFKVPDEISLKEACLLEPISVIVRFLDKSEIKAGQRVLISGGGPIGLLALQAFKMFGATSLTVSEPNENRREYALKFGAEYVIDPINQDSEKEYNRITNSMGYDLIIEASGSPSGAETAIKAVAKGGKIMFVAMFSREYNLPLNLYEKCFEKEITITGTNVSPYTYPRAVQLMKELQLEDFTKKIFYIDQSEEAFAAHASGKWLKVLVQCNKDIDN